MLGGGVIIPLIIANCHKFLIVFMASGFTRCSIAPLKRHPNFAISLSSADITEHQKQNYLNFISFVVMHVRKLKNL